MIGSPFARNAGRDVVGVHGDPQIAELEQVGHFRRPGEDRVLRRDLLGRDEARIDILLAAAIDPREHHKRCRAHAALRSGDAEPSGIFRLLQIGPGFRHGQIVLLQCLFVVEDADTDHAGGQRHPACRTSFFDSAQAGSFFRFGAFSTSIGAQPPLSQAAMPIGTSHCTMRDARIGALRREAVDHHHRADRLGDELDVEFLLQLRRDVGHHVFAVIGRDRQIDLHRRAGFLRERGDAGRDEDRRRGHDARNRGAPLGASGLAFYGASFG